MAALTDTKELTEKANDTGKVSVVASDIIYRGAIVKINAAGNGEPASAEAGAVFAGMATETADNSSGAAGDINCKIQRKGQFLFDGQSGFLLTDVGQSVFASDDQTISVTDAGNEIEVGKISEFVSASSVWVDLAPLG